MNKILLLCFMVSGPCFAGSVANIILLPILSASHYPLCNSEFQNKCFTDLASLEKILADASYFKRIESHAASVTVNFTPGIYRLNKAIEIKWPAVSSANQLRFKSSGDVVISGAKVIDYFYPVKTQDVARFNPNLDKKVMVAAVRSMLNDLSPLKGTGFGWPIKPVVTELFVGNSAMRLARWPNSTYGKIASLPGGAVKDSKHLAIEGQRLAQWSKEPSLNIFAYWFYNWASETLAVESIDLKSSTLTLQGNGSRYGIKEGQRVYVENALSELDDYNEWYLDEKAGLLYFIFPKNWAGTKPEISIAENLFLINDSSFISMSSLKFEKSRGDAVVCVRCKDVVFDDINARLTGNRAFVFTQSGSSGVINSIIEDTGEGGILLEGGDRKTLQVANNFVKKTVINRFSRLGKSYRFAVELDGVAQIVSSNVISNGPHSAIMFSGNDHLIENNYIENVVKETSDAGAIYTGRDFTARGTVITNNFLTEITGENSKFEVKGIYLDDQASGITISKNIFLNVQQAVFIGGGRDNQVEDNYFINSSPAIYLDARGLNWQREDTFNLNKDLQKRLAAVPYDGPIYSSKYTNLKNIKNDELGRPKYNVARRNLVVNGVAKKIEADAISGIIISDFFNERDIAAEHGSFLLKDKNPLNFKLPSDSLAIKKGFRQGNLTLIPRP